MRSKTMRARRTTATRRSPAGLPWLLPEGSEELFGTEGTSGVTRAMRAAWTAAWAVAAVTCLLATAGAGLAQAPGSFPATCQNLNPSFAPPGGAWPALAEQLSRDKIKPGSALARLVQANQDFSLLQPAEASDAKPVPLWLRVNWRRAHPGTRYVAGDRDGGYPQILLDLYRWMLSHQDLRAAPPSPGQAPQAVQVAASESGQQRISGPQTVPVNQSDVRVNASDPQKILVAANEPTGASGRVSIFYSTDGGATWGQSTLPVEADVAFQGEGAVEWTSDGTAWASAVALKPVSLLGFDVIFAYFQVRLYKSTDSGKTWAFDAMLSSSEQASHEERLWVDRGAGSPFKDSVYVVWQDLDAVYFSRRTASDGAWHAAIEVSDVQTSFVDAGAEVESNSAGDVFVFWIDGALGHLFVAKSTDGGASFGTPVLAAQTFGRLNLALASAPDTGALIHGSGAAFRSATADNVYAVWNDLSGDPGCTIWTQQSTFVVGGNSCKSRIWFVRSTDGGQTWSAPVKIQDRQALDDQFNPVLALDESSGRLSVTYYDTAGDPGRQSTNLFYQSSSDGGTTWRDPLQVTTASTEETDIFSDPSEYGFHNGLSVAAGSIVATWTDRRNGAREEIWSALISDPAACASPAVTGLAVSPVPSGAYLSWDPVPGATYRVLRAPASGGPYAVIAAPTLNGYFDAAGGCAAAYYAVAAITGCVSALSGEVSAAGRPASVLYSNDFESGSALADWTAGVLSNFGTAADWRGLQTCPAHSGNQVFRFGGSTCSAGAGPGDLVFAYPQGPGGIPVPAGSSGLQLSFWHRRDFQPGAGGGLLGLALSDLSDACLLIPQQFLSGERYSGTIHSTCLPPSFLAKSMFTGASDSFSRTTVDLDQAFADTFSFAGSLAGHVVEPLFFGFTDCGAPPQAGWFLDDVSLTACLPPPVPAYGFYTISPCRLLDTREAAGPGGGPGLAPGGSRSLTLAGRCGVPPTARALAVNLTVVQPSTAGSLLLYADDLQAAPPASTISFPAGAVRANNAIVALGNGTGGAVAQNQSNGSVHLLIDVTGYFQ